MKITLSDIAARARMKKQRSEIKAYSRLQMSVNGNGFFTAEDAEERRGISNDFNVFLCDALRPLPFIFCLHPIAMRYRSQRLKVKIQRMVEALFSLTSRL
jgi:hypothetical protein